MPPATAPPHTAVRPTAIRTRTSQRAPLDATHSPLFRQQPENVGRKCACVEPRNLRQASLRRGGVPLPERDASHFLPLAERLADVVRRVVPVERQALQSL